MRRSSTVFNTAGLAMLDVYTSAIQPDLDPDNLYNVRTRCIRTMVHMSAYGTSRDDSNMVLALRSLILTPAEI